MINKEELLNNKDFYKSFKTGEDLTSFFKQMYNRALEHMLEAELDDHLDTEKHQKQKNETIETVTKLKNKNVFR
jgi:putative transposase